jgi:XTP/dITP diphosphohydrolase
LQRSTAEQHAQYGEKPEGETRTFGEMSREEKHGLPPLGRGLSHRARAFVALVDQVLT